MPKKPVADVECMICGETPCACRPTRANTRKPIKEAAPTEPAPATVPPVVAPARSSALDAMRIAAKSAPVVPMITVPVHRAVFVPPVVVKTDEQLLEEEAIRLLNSVGFLGEADQEKYRMILDDSLTADQKRQVWRARRRATQADS